MTDPQTPEQRLETLGIELPKPMNLGSLPFKLVRIAGDRAVVSGHLPLAADGSIARPLGKVGADLTAEEGQTAARLAALGMLASLKQELGDLGRISAWLRLFGMVNAAPGFTALPGVINGASQVILDVFGPDRGAHARSAVGMAELPMGVPVEIEAEVLLLDQGGS